MGWTNKRGGKGVYEKKGGGVVVGAPDGGQIILADDHASTYISGMSAPCATKIQHTWRRFAAIAGVLVVVLAVNSAVAATRQITAVLQPASGAPEPQASGRVRVVESNSRRSVVARFTIPFPDAPLGVSTAGAADKAEFRVILSRPGIGDYASCALMFEDGCEFDGATASFKVDVRTRQNRPATFQGGVCDVDLTTAGVQADLPSVEVGDAARIVRRGAGSQNVLEGTFACVGGSSCCVAEPLATTCQAMCGSVTNNCGDTVDCATGFCPGICVADSCACNVTDVCTADCASNPGQGARQVVNPCGGNPFNCAACPGGGG